MRTVFRFEHGRRKPQNRTLSAMRSALEAAGIEFSSVHPSGVRMRPEKPPLETIREVLERARNGDLGEVERAIKMINAELGR